MASMFPAIFFGHGNPMNAIMHNNYTEAWRRIGTKMPKPKAILSISAHWYVPETGVTVTTAPRPSTTSAAFRKSSTRCNIPRRAIPRSPAGFSSCWRRWM